MNGLEWWLTLFTGVAAGATWMYYRERARADAIAEEKDAVIHDLEARLRLRWDELGVPRDDR